MGGHLLTYMHFVRQGRLGEFDYIEIRPHVESGTVVIDIQMYLYSGERRVP